MRDRPTKPDWVSQLADRVVRRFEADQQQTDRPAPTKAVCASGISPSGPIHLGNLRELMVPHFVADEVRRRGVPCEHILSWDDYDRLRKVPAGIDPDFTRHIGRPLTAVPDPHGELDSWAERFKAPLREAVDRLGIELREISQTEQYRSGAYRAEILTALDRREEINEVLGRFRTLEQAKADDGADGDSPESAMESGAEDADDGDIGSDYWPYKVYCQDCGTDVTTITGTTADGESLWIDYRCDSTGYEGRFDLSRENHGKLVWKVDWPMRWAYEGVTFEAGGADHSSPGSSFSVGSELVSRIYGGKAPEYEAYSFVGTKGMGKMSSSAGAVPTPIDALQVVEAPLLRWMYVRKTPRQAITVDLGGGLGSLYDEWDALGRKLAAGEAAGSQSLIMERARTTVKGAVAAEPEAVVPFRTLTSAVAVAADDDAQIARIVSQLTEVAADEMSTVEPRLALARTWVNDFAPEDDRIVVRSDPDAERLAELSEEERRWLDLLLAHLDDDWSLDGTKDLVYGVPKIAAGLPLDTPPTPELKVEQRTFFKLLYQLFLSADTGPRLPTLLMALGPERVRHLLGGAPVASSG